MKSTKSTKFTKSDCLNIEIHKIHKMNEIHLPKHRIHEIHPYEIHCLKVKINGIDLWHMMSKGRSVGVILCNSI